MVTYGDILGLGDMLGAIGGMARHPGQILKLVWLVLLMFALTLVTSGSCRHCTSHPTVKSCETQVLQSFTPRCKPVTTWHHQLKSWDLENGVRFGLGVWQQHAGLEQALPSGHDMMIIWQPLVLIKFGFVTGYTDTCQCCTIAWEASTAYLVPHKIRRKDRCSESSWQTSLHFVFTNFCMHMLRVLGHGPRQRSILFLGRGTWDVSDVSDFFNLSVVQWVLALDRTRGRQEMSCWRSVASLLHR